MDLSESPRTAARFAGAVLAVGGPAGLAADHLMLHRGGANDVLAVLYGGVGLVVWFLPWQRWPSRATLVIAFAGLAMIATSRAMGTEPSASFVASFVVVFLWVGLSQPPGTALALALPAAAAYATAVLVSPHREPTELSSLAVVLPVLVLVAEVPARMVAQLHRARLGEHEDALRFAKDAETDALTGLGNRRFGERVLETLRTGDALLLLDIDHFKAINDRFGHAGGDRFLRELADYLRSTLRVGDDVARFGGEEFLMIARQAPGGAVVIAERIAQHWRDRHPLATFSVGIAVHDDRRGPSDTCHQADTALYRAKRGGRDLVRLFGADPASDVDTDVSDTPTRGPAEAAR